MARTERAAPIAVLLVATAAFVLPFVLSWRGPETAMLPAPGWGHLVVVTLRSLVLPIVASTVAALAGGVIVHFVYTSCPRVVRRLLLAFCVVPFVFSPVVVAAAVEQVVGTPNLFLAATLVALPPAVVGQSLGLRFADAETLMLARSLGMPTLAAWRAAVFPTWSRGAFLGWAWSVLQLFSDPGLPDVYGGTSSHLSSHIFRAVSAGESGPTVMRAMLFMMVPTLLIALVVTRRNFWVRIGARHDPTRFGVADLLRMNATRGWTKLVSGAVAALTVSMIATMCVVIMAGTVSRDPRDPLQTTPILTTILLVIVAVPVGAALGLVLAVAVHRSQPCWRRYGMVLLVLMIFSPPSGIGAVLGTALNRPVVLGDTVVLPALVGGGAVAEGWIGLYVATLAVCVPVSAVVMLALRSDRSSTAGLTARTLGAGSVRAALTTDAVYFWPLLVTSLCVETGILLTSLAPLVFVQPGGSHLVTPQLLSEISGGYLDQAFTLAAVSGLLTGLAVTGLVVVVRVATRERSTWSRK
jgi:iron(III) transport system permease protein